MVLSSFSRKSHFSVIMDISFFNTIINVIEPDIFEILEHTHPGKCNEIQPTDALFELAKQRMHLKEQGMM